jgi:hypothetical protein
MRVLLDECLPRKLKSELPGHDVLTVPEVGWAGKKNGELLDLASGRFDVFVTIDANVAGERSSAKLSFAVVVLGARNNRLETLRPLMPRLCEELPRLQPRQVLRLGV